ncbi:hypothetical protein [Paenibacillus terrigena]|uniref:hypothetical protein n=1 Tax=Paenibacillus terrigena TaxID=369333 RepID=UPI0028D6E38D|nr:hypothetical protein [Paenibacillus terrigena]
MSHSQVIAAFHHTYNNYVSQLGQVLCTDGGIETMIIPSAIGKGLLARMKLRDGMDETVSRGRWAGAGFRYSALDWAARLPDGSTSDGCPCGAAFA